MARPNLYHPNFASDLKVATDYYDGISIDLGNRFRTSVRDRIRQINGTPELYGRINARFRGVLVKQFPYVVLYDDRPKMIVFVGIQHAASDQEGWFKETD
jgi:hypothetical protein